MGKSNRKGLLLSSFRAILKKELLHMARSPMVIAFTFIFPLIDMVILGFFLDINVRQIDTVIYDVARTQESRRLVEQFNNTNDFKVIAAVSSDKELYDTIVGGKAKIGIKIPINYSERLLEDNTANVLVLIDGSNANITAEAITVSSQIGLQESVKDLLAKQNSNNMPIESRISVLFNPETRSANFLLPGVIVFILPSITIMLLAFSIAGERERGTMEQLSLTPLHPAGLIVGKMMPYAALAMVQLVVLVVLIRVVFQVPIQGNMLVLMALTVPYLMSSLGLGAILCARVTTQLGVMPNAFLVRAIAPLYLSGYIFPIEGMPKIFQYLTMIVPERFYLEIVRGVILRGATATDLWFQTTVLSAMSILFFIISIVLYRKSITGT